MSVHEENGHRLWLECRLQENYYRFLGDVLLALNKQISADMPKVRYAAATAGFTINPWPLPPCIPGKPCMKTIRQLQGFVEQMAQRSVEVDNAVYAALEMALDLRIQRISFEASQMPVPPEGAVRKRSRPRSAATTRR